MTYDLTVARLFLLFLIVLLPLRGWASDAMSVRMAGAQMVVQLVAGGSVVADMASLPPDCPAHAQADEHGGGASGDCASSCDLCLPLAAPACARVEPIVFARHAKPLMPTFGFLSAALVPVKKPPIF